MSRIPGSPGQLFTVGHSTHSLEDFLKLLERHGIGCLIDVRSVPKSRRMPHFARESLEEVLPRAGIRYAHLRELGGWRRSVPDSPNSGWRSKGFQGYADHMQTPEFKEALEHVEQMAVEQRSAIMCAEALWWRCHRMLIADALVVRGWRVRHIGATAKPEDHSLTSFAVVEEGRLIYPPVQGTLENTPPR